MNRMLLVLALWGALAMIPALVGIPPIAVPIAIFSLVLLGVLAQLRPTVRAAVAAIDSRTLVAVHAIRAPIGATFLLLHAAGHLPTTFAVRAGVGDIVVGVAALFVLSSPRIARAWNVVGFLDLAMVLVTVQKLVFVEHDPLMRAAIAHFPFPLLPFFVVPVLLLSHLALFARLRVANLRQASAPYAKLQ